MAARHSLAVPPPRAHHAAARARLKRPRELTHFSYDASHAYRPDGSSLKYYYTPALGTSLSRGWPEKFQQQEDGPDEHLDGLLRAVADLERRGGRAAVPGAEADGGYGVDRSTAEQNCDDDNNSKSNDDSNSAREHRPQKLDVDVVTWRGMMTKILTAPYSDRDGFEMNATRFQGTIYIEENHGYKLESRARQLSQRPRPGMPSQELMTYWGYKFETLAVLPQPWSQTDRDFIEGRDEHVVNNAEQYCSVVETGAADVKLVLGGEVDAVWDERPLDPADRTNWVELKTSAVIRDSRDAQRFESKLLKFWAQSFLLGVSRIIVGFRTNDMEGRLVELQEFETTKIPKMVDKATGAPSWDSNICIQFLADFLRCITDTITEDGVWRISRLPRDSEIVLTKLEETGHGDILSEDFVRWRQELADMHLAKAPE